jgi:Protein of unknown function (DUF3592)
MTAPLMPMIALAVSTALALRACRAFALGRASLRWTRVEGTVLQLGFDESAVYDGDGDDDVAFSVHLSYAYTVRGRRYRSERFTYRPTRGLEQRHAYAMLRGLRRGRRSRVNRRGLPRPRAAGACGGVDGHRQRQPRAAVSLGCGGVRVAVVGVCGLTAAQRPSQSAMITAIAYHASSPGRLARPNRVCA